MISSRQPTEWRSVKNIMLDRGYTIKIYGLNTHKLYECNECGFVLTHDTSNPLPFCSSCARVTGELASTPTGDQVWHVLNNWNSETFLYENAPIEEIDVFHMACDCPEPPDYDDDEISNVLGACESLGVDDLEIPICTICNGCTLCRYYYDSDDYNEETLFNFSE